MIFYLVTLFFTKPYSHITHTPPNHPYNLKLMPPTYKDYTFDYLDNNTPSTPSPIIDNANVPDHAHVPVPEYVAHQKTPNINPPTLNPSYLNTSPITSQ